MSQSTDASISTVCKHKRTNDHGDNLPRKRPAHETTLTDRDSILQTFGEDEVLNWDRRHILLFLRNLPAAVLERLRKSSFPEPLNSAIAEATSEFGPGGLARLSDEAFELGNDDKIFANVQGGELLAAFTNALGSLQDRVESPFHAASMLLNPVDEEYQPIHTPKLTHVTEASEFLRDMVLSWLDVRFRTMRMYHDHAGSLGPIINAPRFRSISCINASGQSKTFSNEAWELNKLMNCRFHGGNLRHDVMLWRLNYIAARIPGQWVTKFEDFYEEAFEKMYGLSFREALWLIQQMTDAQSNWDTNIDLIDKYVTVRDLALDDLKHLRLPKLAKEQAIKAMKEINTTHYEPYAEQLSLMCRKGTARNEITKADLDELETLRKALIARAQDIRETNWQGQSPGPWVRHSNYTPWAPTWFLNVPAARVTKGGMVLQTLPRPRYTK